ncbi:hypothetical protein PybrP1_009704 [[Pythium] brassicae (nom. inval.)]|nr:hypothetical protein PybrP1_009704 [[Pythium] brassicae (nom. inval.)]
MVDAQHSASGADADATTSAARTSTLSPSVQGDEGFGASAYHATLKDEDVQDLTEGEESLYSGSISSPYFYGSQVGTPTPTPTPQHQYQHLHLRDDDEFFPSYAGTPQPELDDQIRPTAWEYYYPPVATGASAPPPPPPPSSSSLSPSAPTATSPPPMATPNHLSRHPQQLPSRFPQDAQHESRMQSQGSLSGLRFAAAATTSTFSASSIPMASPTVSIASSMIAMRNNPEALDLAHTSKALLTHAATAKPSATAFAPNTINLSTNSINLSIPKALPSGATIASRNSSSSSATGSRKVKKETALAATDDQDEEAALGPAAKKTKVSRERQLKINAASRRCRKKQKQLRATRLSQFLDDSVRKVDEMSSGSRPTSSAASSKAASGDGEATLKAKAGDDRSGDDTDGLSAGSDHRMSTIEVDDVRGVHAIDPMTGYHLTEERKKMLLNIASFVRVNMSLESRSFSPEVISCLPIEMDGWQLRLSITEKNYTIHNCKFFPCNLMDMYDFCWETNVSQKISIKQGKKHYSVVTPLDRDVAHVYSKTIGKWSLSVHGVPNVSYNSLVCRRYEADQHRAIICQQSVLEERDFEDESTLPWLFKRWVVFQPHVVDGVHGTLVEAYRTASYATGKLIYKENNTYDSFCEHLIRRYAESNSLLERMMARDKRFQHVAAIDVGTVSESDLDYEETASDRMVKDLLLF